MIPTSEMKIIRPRNKPVIYIAGPYRGDSEYAVNQNIERAAIEAVWVWSVGGIALCPHLNTRFFGGAYGLPDEVWLEGDLLLLDKCDAVYFISGWKSSEGCRGEWDYALQQGVEVIRSRTKDKYFIMNKENI